MVSCIVLRVAAAFQKWSDTYDTQLAINQILIRNGWEQASNGKLIRRVRVPFQHTPKVYVLETLRDGDLAVRDNGGRVLTKVDLSDHMSNTQIMDAAKRLNSGISGVVAR